MITFLITFLRYKAAGNNGGIGEGPPPPLLLLLLLRAIFHVAAAV
jgi:hypothetical protein